jgi:hypothetical protein
MRIPFITLIAGGALALGGCAYGGLDMGLGYGGGYGDYGYGAGYGGYYGAGYGGYGYGSPYYGWYDDYYYPGTGIYVYDSYRRPRAWTSRERSYWTGRQRMATRSGTKTTTLSTNWNGFNRRQQQTVQRQQVETQDQQHHRR